MGVQNSGGIHHYIYDSKGERIMKGSLLGNSTAVNGDFTQNSVDLDGYLLYVNPYFVVQHYSDWVDGSKHYYMGTQRIASETMGYLNDQGPDFPHVPEPMKASSTTPYPTTGALGASSAWQSLEYVLEELDAITGSTFWTDVTQPIKGYKHYFAIEDYRDQIGSCSDTNQQPPEYDTDCLCAISPYWAARENEINCEEYRQIYWYHPDYLGHTEYITDKAGRPYQYFHYAAFGEVLVQKDANYGNFDSRYTFNAKEFDKETGLGYYGARYYNPMTSVWLSVDPLSNHPNQVDKSPYAFSWNNPVMLVDPDGRCPKCEESVSDPSNGQVYESTGGQAYQYSSETGEWTGLGGELNEVTVTGTNPTPQEKFSKAVNSQMNNNLKNGELNREDFINNYRYGKGKSSIAPIALINLDGLTVESFGNPTYYYEDGQDKYPAIQINYDQGFYKDPDHAFIFGTITVILIGDNLIMALPDTYNFDLKNDFSTKGMVRNFGTMIGQAYNGAGNGFPIYIMGTKRIPYSK